MPAVMKIKTEGTKCEVKTLVDSESRIRIRLEINEGRERERMSQKECKKEFGASTVPLLRLYKP